MAVGYASCAVAASAGSLIKSGWRERERESQTDRQTDRQAGSRQAADRLTASQASQPASQAGRQADTHTDRQTDRQTDRDTERERETDRQTDNNKHNKLNKHTNLRHRMSTAFRFRYAQSNEASRACTRSQREWFDVHLPQQSATCLASCVFHSSCNHFFKDLECLVRTATPGTNAMQPYNRYNLPGPAAEPIVLRTLAVWRLGVWSLEVESVSQPLPAWPTA